MKKFIFIILLISVSIQAQENRYEKIKALKTAYITDELALTSSEAEKFWPVYNSFETQFHDLRHRKYRGIYENFNSETEKLNDEQANKLIDEFLSIETSQLELQKQKIAALRKVISPQKIIRLRKAEDDFKQELLNRYRRGKEKK